MRDRATIAGGTFSCGAAEGYARTTGKVGVCLATSGPGATNFVTCLADAKMYSTPIIAITGTHIEAAVLRLGGRLKPRVFL